MSSQRNRVIRFITAPFRFVGRVLFGILKAIGKFFEVIFEFLDIFN